MTYDYYYYKVLYQENGIGYQNNWSLIYDIEVTYPINQGIDRFPILYIARPKNMLHSSIKLYHFCHNNMV